VGQVHHLSDAPIRGIQATGIFAFENIGKAPLDDLLHGRDRGGLAMETVALKSVSSILPCYQVGLRSSLDLQLPNFPVTAPSF
jgi:hypothetical protein